MDTSFESLFKSNLNSYMEDMFTCLPAIVVGVQRIQDGLIDVQPLINKVYRDGSKNELPVIHGIPVIMPSTMKSSITMPVSQGDNVLLLFSQKDLEIFKNGSGDPHDPATFRTFNINDCVALIGLTTTPKSFLNANNHKIPFNNNSLILSHNLGTEKESYIEISQGGEINIEAKSSFSLSCKSMDVKAESVKFDVPDVQINSSNINLNSTVFINGMNLNLFMTQHVHSGVQSGSSSTLPPTQQG